KSNTAVSTKSSTAAQKVRYWRGGFSLREGRMRVCRQSVGSLKKGERISSDAAMAIAMNLSSFIDFIHIFPSKHAILLLNGSGQFFQEKLCHNFYNNNCLLRMKLSYVS
ncbi:MAG TPA: hypothetical protein VJ969_06585, partial [Desulfopila sp.]|nr:hypothetical protein [Desulfopila sp.]